MHLSERARARGTAARVRVHRPPTTSPGAFRAKDSWMDGTNAWLTTRDTNRCGQARRHGKRRVGRKKMKGGASCVLAACQRLSRVGDSEAMHIRCYRMGENTRTLAVDIIYTRGVDACRVRHMAELVLSA